MFYILVILLNIAQLGQYSILFLDPGSDVCRLDLTCRRAFIAVLDWVIMTAMFAIGTVVAYKMYQLSISLRKFLGLISAESVSRHKKWMYIFYSLCNIIYAALNLYEMALGNIGMISVLAMSFYIILTFFYSLTIVQLQRSLQKLTARVNCQNARCDVLI